MRGAIRTIWACARKDIAVALTSKFAAIIALFLPVNVLILMSLFVLGGSRPRPPW